MPNSDLKIFDQLRMLECLSLAEKGAGYVSPNPMVGAVVVKNGTIMGRGYHRRFGGSHAEVLALRQAGHRARGATLYVNLEPCCHYGKTAPCTDLILKSGIKRVVIGLKDPNPLVNGRGIRRLQSGKVEVVLNILEHECKKLNEVFTKFITSGLPFVVLKIAQTLDGKIADAKGHSHWITDEFSRKIVHALRARYDAVLVGANTIIKDNPQLTVRVAKGRNPYRVILDGNFSVPLSSKVFQDKQKHRTFLFVSNTVAKRKKIHLTNLRNQGVRINALSRTKKGMLDIRQVLGVLADNNISSVLVEGGAHTYAEFIKARAVDKLVVFIAPKILGDGLSAFQYLGMRDLRRALHFSNFSSWNLKGDMMVEAYLQK